MGCRAALQKGLESRGKFFDEMQATKVLRNWDHKSKSVCEKERCAHARAMRDALRPRQWRGLDGSGWFGGVCARV